MTVHRPVRGLRLTVLGAGTLVPNGARHSAAHLVEVADVRILFDCGPGALHGFDRYDVDWKVLTHVVVSHFHNDHIGDLPALLFAFRNAGSEGRRRPLTLIGPVGLGELLARLEAAFGAHVGDPRVPLDVIEMEADRALSVGEGATMLRSHSAEHAPESLAYRVDAPQGSFGYTGDTGPSDGLAAFLGGVDLALVECGQADPPDREGHLSPLGVADFLDVARPSWAGITHVYPPLEPEEAVKQIRLHGYQGALDAAFDGQRVASVDGRVVVDPRSPPD